MRLTDPGEACAVIASHVLGCVADTGPLGNVVLQRHQADAVRRARDLIRSHGGALLADEVGLGKTFVALAVAADYERVFVVGPASLRAMWRDAARRAGVRARFVSMEFLGHGGAVPSADFIIVDEAHHFRNPAAKRYAQLAEACARAPVLLLSATPVQNQLTDLRNVLALLLGRRAATLDLAALGRLVIRRGSSALRSAARLPRVLPPQWVSVDPDVGCLDRLCGLPAPTPPSDGGRADALLTLSLARQWSSSRAALVAALTRRLAMGHALADALSSGRHLTRAELALWKFADGAQQLAFPELSASPASVDALLLEQVRTHTDAVRELLAWLRAQRDVDDIRAERLREIAEQHRGERVVAFAEFTATVAALYRRLAPTCRVAMLTAGGGRVAGGAVTRQEVLSQFAPGAAAPEHARIDLLLSTDVLSEGVDLQGASVVVHLDLTWNPARMEQRVGRLRRMRAARDAIAVYVFSPPAPAERLLQLDRRLREKLGEAARSVGLAGAILPGVMPATDSIVGRRERVLELLRTWLAPVPVSDAMVWSAVQWATHGVVACVRCSGDAHVIAMIDGRIEVEPSAELLCSIHGRPRAECSESAAMTARDQIERWLERRALTRTVEGAANGVARARRTILDRVNGIERRARRHERSSLNAMLGAARHAATATMPAGAERVLDQLARATLPDDAWLRAIGEFGSIHGRPSTRQRNEILAMLLLVPDA